MFPANVLLGQKAGHIIRSAASYLTSFASTAVDGIITHPTILLLQMKELKFSIAILFLMLLLLSFCSPASLVSSVVRLPLRKLGLGFGSIEISMLTLSVVIHHIEMLPLDVPILQSIFVALFPSANARSAKETPDCYPCSKVRIQRLKVTFKSIFRDDVTIHMSWAKRAFCRILPRPMIIVKMKCLVVEVEKAYIAPIPPANFGTMTTQLPYAISMQQYPELPMFDQNYHLEELRNAEILEADSITYCLERWLQHVVAKMRNNDSDSNATDTATSDERFNSWISLIARIFLQSLSFYIDSASVIISGAGSDVVKKIRQRFSLKEANFHLAKLHKEQRALTIIGTSMMKMSFSSDPQCNLLIYFSGLEIKVGNPRLQKRRSSVSSTDSSRRDLLHWQWYSVVPPFDAVAELKGVISFVVYSLSYDHYWEERVLGLDLSISSEVSLTLSPNHLHTLFLHLDDYTDLNSPYNQWLEWLKSCHQQTLNTSRTERLTYCRNYAKKIETFLQTVTAAQMKEIEKKMKCSEIMSLRCSSMKDSWVVPQESNDFLKYLKQSQSEINIDDADHSAEGRFSPFQRMHASALDALAALAKEKSSILAPRTEIKLRVGTLKIDFPFSFVSVSGISFSVDRFHPLFTKCSNDMRRPFIGVSVQVNDLHWTVCTADVTKELRLPTFPDKSLVGIAHKDLRSQSNVLDVNLSLSVAPTSIQDLYVSVDLSSSDLVFIANPIPLRLASQCLLDLMQLPFQETTEVSLVGDKTAILQNDNNIGRLRTTLSATFKRMSVFFLVDLEEIRRGLLHFAVNSVLIRSTSLCMSGELSVSTEPFVLSAAQFKRKQLYFDWSLLPFKPIVTIIGSKAAIIAERQQNPESGPKQNRIDVNVKVESFEINASPSTTAALLGSVQSIVASMEVETNTGDAAITNQDLIQKVEKHDIQFQRNALLNTFHSAGVDSAELLDGEDLDKIILFLCNGHSSCAHHLTATEIEREKDFVFSLAGGELTLDKVNTMLFRFANGIDESNFAATRQASCVGCETLSQFAHFSSEVSLHDVIYFDDLREYSSMHEVYRITGVKKMYKTSLFPPPILWHQGQGVDLFWELYKSECGCSRKSIFGQEMKTVQQKLVRSLCNFKFAKYCWKSLVQPGLISNHDVAETNWLLDDDPIQHIRGFFVSLLQSINKESTERKKTDNLSTYVLSVSVVVSCAAMSFGSAQNFTKPLFEARFSRVSLSLSAFLSQDGKFIDDFDCYDEPNNSESIRNVVKFCSGDFHISYLNTKHGHMEPLIEPYLCLGSVSYNVPRQESEKPSLAIDLKCPKTLFINISPVFFETTTITATLISQAEPKTYQKVLFERDKRYLNTIWEANPRTKRGFPNREDAIAMLRILAQSHWQEDFEGLSEAEIDKKIVARMNAAHVGETIVRMYRLEHVLRNHTHCFFSGCKKLLLSNSLGISINATAENVTKIIEADSLVDVSLGRVTLVIERYQIVDDVPLSPYQPTMMRLTRHSKLGRRKKRTSCGFDPFLTVVPNQDSLDAIKLDVRSCIQIKSEIPIRVRIVRLPKKLGYLQKRNTKLVDLTKKNLAAALRRVANGALIVHEVMINEGSVAAIPLNIVLSSAYHALLFQDVYWEESDSWRDPVLMTKEFLFNEMNLREVSKCHALSGISVKRERLNVHYSAARRSKPLTSDPMRSISKTAWDTTISVVPFFLLSNAMPFPILIKAWQYRPSDENDLWRDPIAIFSDPSEPSNDIDSNSEGETSSKSPSLMGRSTSSQQYHLPKGSRGDDHYSMSSLDSGKTLRLCGINLSYPLYIQICQRLLGTLTGWSNVATVNLQKLRTGINPNKGSLSLKSIPIRLGDDCDCLIDVAVDGGICGALYSPFWLINRTGMKLEYSLGISNKRYLDTGTGGLPVMIHHCENNTDKGRTKEISVIPLENPTADCLGKWWDEQRNGKLVLTKGAINNRNNSVGWSEKIEMDAAGTSGEVHCKDVVFSVSIDSLAGDYFRSNICRFTPRFVVQNSLHMSLSLVALSGSTSQAIHKAKQLRNFLTSRDEKSKVDLGPGESTVIYSFNDTGDIGRSFRWITFRVNASRRDGSCPSKWHLVRLDKNGSTYFGEIEGRNLMVGIIDATVHRSDGCSLLCTISHATVPPYQIENRSNTHYLRFAQYGDEAVVFELPPMQSCGYTWDNPFGKKRLRAAVIQKGSHDCSNVKSKGDGCDLELHSKFYKMRNAGRKQPLQFSRDDCHFSILVHLRISAGTKILSFSDSDFIAGAVEAGISSKSSNFENSFCDIFVEGVNISIVDNFPKELLAITAREVSMSKPVGSNEARVLVRHFQVDAMIADARYPIIIRPLPQGIDKRKPQTNELILPENLNSNDFFWINHIDDRPSPVFEANFKYVPQKNMMWIPSLNVFLCPMKVTLDLDYLLRVASVFICPMTQHRSDASAGHKSTVNDKLKYSSHGTKIVSLTYLERLTIAPVWFEVEICLKSDGLGYDESDGLAAETALTLNSIARASNSSAIAGIVGWLSNVGSEFSHVTPCFKYPSVFFFDKFCDPLELVQDIMFFYVVQTIKQSLKVLFSMQFIGDPTLLALQLRTGFTDLVWRTRDEVRSGGREGFGRGLASFSENAVGGTFFAVAKVAKSIANTVDALVKTEFTSKHLRPKELDRRKRPRHAIDGFVHGVLFLGRELVFGTAGLIGSPYRGIMSRKNVSSLAKGVASGVGGFVVSPFVGALGFVAITFEGLGATAKYLELSEIEARCRPARVVPWGTSLNHIGLGFLKAIGIRIHTVRYQKMRKAALLDDQDEGDDYDYLTSKEHKRIRAAELRRTNPPSKVLRIKYKKENRRYETTSINPKLLTDHPGGQMTSHYAAVFEQSIILRANNLQFTDEVKIQFRNSKISKGIVNTSSTLGTCKFRIGDIYSHLLKLHHDELVRKESRLSEEHVHISDEIRSQNASIKCSSLIVPPPQEFALMRTPKKSKPLDDVFEAISNEMRDIQRCDEELKKSLETDSVHSDSSFLGKKKKKEEDIKSVLSKNERLFGSISISFYPIPW